MWNLLRPRIEPVSPALAGKFLSTAPPGESSVQFSSVQFNQWVLVPCFYLLFLLWIKILHQFSSVIQSCQTLCDPMNHRISGLPVDQHLPQFTQTHVHRVSDAIQPSHPLSSPSLLGPNPSQHQGLFQWVNSLYEVAKVLEFQQHQSAVSKSLWPRGL